MYLTQCAACAAPLGLTLGKKCGRCSTRYCGAACQGQHWKEGGHDTLCKKIKKAGGAEQYNANQKYTAAVTVAVEKCADDTKGQTCYICTQALHWKTKEGLVRGCACRGTAGFAHVSCLAEQAKILLAEAMENRLGDDTINQKWQRWHTCSLCEQDYHSVVRCALGWAGWKTYVGRPERDQLRCMAMNLLGNGISEAGNHEDALPVKVAELAMKQRLGWPEKNILDVQCNLANIYDLVGRGEEALEIYQYVYSRTLELLGEANESTVLAASNYADHLINLGRFEEAKALLSKMMPVAQRLLGESNDVTLMMRTLSAKAFYQDESSTLDELRKSVGTLEDTTRTARRVLGGTHPLVVNIEACLQFSRAKLGARDGVNSICAAVEAMAPGHA